jgi:hypothetical protein
MKFQSIAEIYDTNDSIRERLKASVSSISPEESTALPDGEKWTIAQIVEHISLVEDGIGRICSKLLSKAQAEERSSEGSISLSAAFIEKGGELARTKVQAPEVVQPTGERSIAESLAKLEENRRKLRLIQPLFESHNATDYKFPHPYFGEISAVEWLTLVGGHEMRHIKQIERLLDRIRI